MVQHQTMNLAFDLSQAAFRNANYSAVVQFNLRFVPDEVIVKTVTYATLADGDFIGLQVYSDMVTDQIIAQFNTSTVPASTVFNPELHFDLVKKFQSGSYQFQIQNTPNQAVFGWTGPCTVPTIAAIAATGILQIMLEFRKHD